jgi:histidyl-tRNA synthetase
VQGLLDNANVEYQLNPYLVRGLDYYTRTVFEFYPGGASGQQDAVASGGRYDGLAAAEGWPATPGVGFAGGLDRVTELMAASGEEVIGSPPSEVLILPDGELNVEAATVARICRAVRSVAVDYEPKSLRAKMRAANKLGARWVVLISAEEASRQTAQLKEMASGEQVEVAWADLPTRLA